MLYHRHKLTPYAGQTLSGVVEQTFLRGEMIYERGQFSETPSGVMLKRGVGMSDYTELIDLASERLGGAVLYANDDFLRRKRIC